MVQWKMKDLVFVGNYYWRHTHFSLNHDYVRKGIPPEKWSYGSATNYNPSYDPYNPSYNPIEYPVSGVISNQPYTLENERLKEPI